MGYFVDRDVLIPCSAASTQSLRKMYFAIGYAIRIGIHTRLCYVHLLRPMSSHYRAILSTYVIQRLHCCWLLYEERQKKAQ